jgi:deoxyribose-phosphate aldolase
MALTPEQQRFAAYIDHTLLKPEATQNAVRIVCEEALRYTFASVCINPCYVEYAAEQLKGSSVKVCTVIGFPLGANCTAIKVAETELAIRQGAKEVDMVLNVGALTGGNLKLVEHDIRAVIETAHQGGALAKVIIETALLTEAEKIAACEIVSEAEADFIKTSTGFASKGAVLEDIHLMKKHVAPDVEIKASGGIRDLVFAQQLIEAGATRLGASAGVAIIQALAGGTTTPAGDQGY